MAIEITGRINLDSSSVDEATESVRDLKNEIEETSEATNSIATNDGFFAIKDGADVAAGSVSALVGAIALLGIENKYIENLSQGAVGAIALANGVDQAGRGLINLSQNTKVATIAQRAFNVVANANPYILLGTAVVGATVALVALSRSLGNVKEETEKVAIAYNNLVPDLDNAKLAYENLKTAIDQVFSSEQENRINAATSGITKSIEVNVSLLSELQRNLDEVIEKRNIQIRGAAKFNEAFTAEYLQSLSTIDLEREKLIAEARGKGDQARAIDFELQRRELQAQVSNTNRIILQGEEAKQTIIDEKNKEAAEKRSEERIKRLQELKQETVEIIQEVEVLTDTLNDRSIIIPQIGQQTEEVINNIRGLSVKQVDAITNTTDSLEGNLQSIEEKTQNTFAFLGGLNELFTKDETERAKRSFNINKASALAGAIVDTAFASQKAFASQILPGDPTSIVRGFAAAAAAGVAGAARVSAIARTQFNPTGGGGNSPRPSTGGGSAGSAIQTAVPNFDIISTNIPTVGGPGSINTDPSDTPLIRAFVSETDLTNTNNRLQLIRNGSEL